MSRQYWLVATVYGTVSMELQKPEVFGPFGTELERDNKLAEFAEEDQLVAHFGFSLPTGVQPAEHVLGLFPQESSDQVLPAAWLDHAGKAHHVKAGKRRLAIDLATGSGGDKTVLLVRDDNGVLAIRSFNGFETTATEALKLVHEFGIQPHDVTFVVGVEPADFCRERA